MNISEVRELAQEKMSLHGIGHWKLKMVHSKSFAGRCRTRYFHKLPSRSNGEIELSIDYMEVFPYEEVLDTILHEIAHGLVPNDVKSHGPEWKHMAKSIGARPLAHVPAGIPRPKTRYVGTCSANHTYGRSRATSGLYNSAGFYCTQCPGKKGDRAYIEWVDTHTNMVLNPSAQPRSVSAQVPVKVAAKKPVQPKAPTSWKDRYDQGTSSFDDVW